MAASDYPLLLDLGSHLIKYDPAELDVDKLVDGLRPDGILLRTFDGLRRDRFYHELRAEFEKKGLPIGSWHVLGHMSVSEQIADEIDYVPDPGPLRRWVDFEKVSNNAGVRKLPTAAGLSLFWDKIEAHDLMPCGCYTNAYIVDGYLGSISTEKLNARPWWYAQYLTIQKIGTILREYPPEYMRHAARVARENELMLQTASQHPPPAGSLMHATAVDRDRWIAKMSLEDFVGAPPLPVLTLEERVDALENEARYHNWKV